MIKRLGSHDFTWLDFRNFSLQHKTVFTMLLEERRPRSLIRWLEIYAFETNQKVPPTLGVKMKWQLKNLSYKG